jgi:hypothetical protein
MSSSQKLGKFGLIVPKKTTPFGFTSTSTGSNKLQQTSKVGFAFKKQQSASAVFSAGDDDDDDDDALEKDDNVNSITELSSGVAASSKPTKQQTETQSDFNQARNRVNKDVIRMQMAMTSTSSKYDALTSKALEEDPNVFDYDGVYDAMKESEERARKKRDMGEVEATTGRKKVTSVSFLCFSTFLILSWNGVLVWC